jgi:hypothetical protein
METRPHITPKELIRRRVSSTHFLQPLVCPDLFASVEGGLAFLEGLVELFIAEDGVSEGEEGLAGKFVAQAAVLEAFLVGAAVVERTDVHSGLCCPERLTIFFTAASAGIAQVFAVSAVEPAYGCEVSVSHINPSVCVGGFSVQGTVPNLRPRQARAVILGTVPVHNAQL